MSATPAKKPYTSFIREDENEGDYVPVGLEGVLASTEKLLQVNQGLVSPDERDHLAFKRILSPDVLLRERIRLDHGGIRRKMMQYLARTKDLEKVPVHPLDDYTEGFITDNPLAMPLEEINPMHLVEQQRRISMMGPGGLPSTDVVTPEAQNVHPSQFGFISASEGPECVQSDCDIFTKRGWVKFPDVIIEDELACLIDGALEFHKPERLICAPYDGELIGINGDQFQWWVTPNHRMLYKHSWSDVKVAQAHTLFARSILVPTSHAPYIGTYGIGNFVIPVPSSSYRGQKNVAPIPMVTWAAFMGYWLAEGWVDGSKSLAAGDANVAYISNDKNYRPIVWEAIRLVLEVSGFLDFSYSESGRRFSILNKQLACYLQQFGKSGDKFIPEYFFDEPIAVREALLHAFLTADTRVNETHTTYTSTSRKLAEGVQRLMISLGHPTRFFIEQDSRPNVKSTNYCCGLLKKKWRGTTTNLGKGLGAVSLWATKHYSGNVYCATVPGGFIFTRTGRGIGFWSGNSSLAGVDVRVAWGTKLGSDGNIYQKFKDKHGKSVWLSPQDTQDKTIALPK